MRTRFWVTVGAAFLSAFAAKLLADQFLIERVPILGSFAGLTPSLNPGIAFGVTFPGPVQAVIIPVALVVILIVALSTMKSPLHALGFGLIIGGAFGNLLDRVPDGVVTDFFQVGAFPVFNVADSWITIGVAVLLLEMVIHRKYRQK